MSGHALNGSYYTRYCVILGVPENASQDELKRAYKTAAMKNHLDKGGDAEKDVAQKDREKSVVIM